MKDLQGSLSNRYIYNPKGLPCYSSPRAKSSCPHDVLNTKEEGKPRLGQCTCVSASALPVEHEPAYGGQGLPDMHR
jgi:hypothetical protein